MIWAQVPHGTLQHSMYRFYLVTRVQWMRMQEHDCSYFKRYANTFHCARSTNAINSKVINLELKSFVSYSFSTTKLLTLFYRLVRADIKLFLNGMLSRSRYTNFGLSSAGDATEQETRF